MRTEVITRDIYTLDELDETARERAIEHWARVLAEDWDPAEATESVNYWLADLLGPGNLTVTEWDTGRAQSVTFDGSINVGEVTEHLTALVQRHPEWEVVRQLFLTLPHAVGGNDWSVWVADNRYTYDRWESDAETALEDVDLTVVREVVEAWEEWLESLRSHCLTYLIAEVDDADSEERVADFIEANECEFLADGSVA